MKNKVYLVLFFLFSFFHFVSAQQEFAPIGASWHYPETYFWSGNIGVVNWTSIGDTIIDNKSCRIIYKDNWTCYSDEGNHFFHQSNDSIFYYNQTLETFSPYFIFNAEVGDSWVFQVNGSVAFSDSMKCEVDSISYYPIQSGDSIRIQHVTITDLTIGSGEPFHQTKLIENIGFELAFIPFTLITLCDADYDGDIRCYEDPNIGLINFSNVDCNFTPTIDLNISDIEIYPNPTSDFLFVKSRESLISKIEIINLQGNIVAVNESIFPENKNIEIKTDDLSSGIYFLSIKHNNTFTIKKIIVQK